MYKEFILSLVKEVAVITKKYFQNSTTSYKSDGSVVTIADTTINSLVIQRVKEQFPTHDIYGEEESFLENNSEYVWVCDPIDGTIPFSLGVPTSSFSLALTKQGQPIVAAVYDSHLDKLFYAEKGKGAFCNDEPIVVNDREKLCYVCLSHWQRDAYDVGDAYVVIVQEGANCFDFGSIVYAGILVASGKIEGIVFPHTTAHDVAAIKLIIEEAGGMCSDIFGNKQSYNDTVKGFIATNKKTHKMLLGIVTKTMKIRE